MTTESPAGRMAGPTILRHRLGTELRRMRLARSMRLEDVAARLDVAPSTLSRIEAGKAPARTSYVRMMLDLYGADDPAVRRLLTDLAREGQRKGWWAAFDDVLSAEAGECLGLETAASEIRCFAMQAIPGLLRTEDYDAMVWRATRPGADREELARLVAVTLRRQELLHSGGLTMHAVIDEAALRRTVGSGPIMACALEHLLAVSSRLSVTVQVAALRAALPVLSLPFALLSFGSGDPDVGCACGTGGQAAVIRSEAQVSDLRRAFAALAHAALSPTGSAELIRELAQDYRSGHGAA